jgi:enterochelin esterase-like enzyme
MNINMNQITKVRPQLNNLTSKRRIRKSVLTSYRNVTRQYPQWQAALFDEHFVDTHMVPMVETAVRNGERVYASQLADEWSQQLRLNERSRQELVAELVPLVDKIFCNMEYSA